jgi:fumarate hydratase class II
MLDKTIATFQKNKFQEVRVGIREFKGNDLVDIRTWTMTQGSNEMVPTAKGVTINVALFAELKKALEDVEKTLKENKMI